MSLFKTNFMKLVETYLQDQGFTVELCNIFTRGVDFYQSYKRIIICAYKEDLLLCIRARSGDASDPFRGLDDQIEQKLQEPALKLLSCVLSLNSGIDPIYCEKFEGMTAVPIIIMEKSSRGHPLYYFFDGEARESKEWYKKKNVVYLPWEWIKEFWNQDFEESLKSQGYKVSEPIEYEGSENIQIAVSELEEIFASRRIGVIKSVYLSKPTLPPLVLTLTNEEQMMIFMVDEADETLHTKLMDFAVYYFGTKTTKFPSTAKAMFFNIITKTPKDSFLIPYLPKDNEFVEKNFDKPVVIKTTIKGFKQLLEVAIPEEIASLHQLSEIPSMENEALLRVSSGYWFSGIFNEAKKRMKKFYSSKCPFCSNSAVVHQIPDIVVSKLNLKIDLDKENSYIAYCDNKKSGCGMGFLVIKDVYQGGVHGIFTGGEQQYAHEIGNAKQKIKDIGLEVQSFQHIPIN
ncbi:MAG: hypothetical protein KGD64_05770 [Candidatus Heimdallarchaeota archaeon]|nr:hypothetical protein [Candidatus Heimdallarchaeota archaeon]